MKQTQLEKRIQEVKESYLQLPKSTNDDGEFVIIAQKDNGGNYEEYKECLGVNGSGDLIWAFLSGCSCYGGNENQKVTDITAKIFKVEARESTAEEFYEKNKCEPLKEFYKSY